MERIIHELRSKTRESLEKHHYANAIFFADKLVTLTNGHCDDVYMLGEAYYGSKQYKRASYLLTQAYAVNTQSSIKCRHLAAKCMEESGGWVECITILGPEESQFEELLKTPDAKPYLGSLCFLWAKAHEMIDNKKKAVDWYKRTLKCDPMFYEAFERLVDNHLLATSAEETQFLDSIQFGESLEWLKLLYQTKIKKFNLFTNKNTASTAAANNNNKAGKGIKTGSASPTKTDTNSLVPACYELLDTKYGLKQNQDVMCSIAEYHYYSQRFSEAYELTKSIMAADPFQLNSSCLAVHLCCLVELGRKNDLFYTAHKLVDTYPTSAASWFAVGCYYYAIKKWDQARKYFSKATSLDNKYLPAWIGLGHSYANADEEDQAMAAYRTAFRLFSGCHIPPLCVGMEYAKTNNLILANEFIRQAMSICNMDPLVHNELAVVCYKNKMYDKAMKYFQFAIDLCSNNEYNEIWEIATVNLAHTYRKLRLYDRAIEQYEKSLSIKPRNAAVFSALGFTYHLKGDLNQAIDNYHKALGLRSEDTFTSDMLSKAIEEMFEYPLSLDDGEFGDEHQQGEGDEHDYEDEDEAAIDIDQLASYSAAITMQHGSRGTQGNDNAFGKTIVFQQQLHHDNDDYDDNQYFSDGEDDPNNTSMVMSDGNSSFSSELE